MRTLSLFTTTMLWFRLKALVISVICCVWLVLSGADFLIRVWIYLVLVWAPFVLCLFTTI